MNRAFVSFDTSHITALLVIAAVSLAASAGVRRAPGAGRAACAILSGVLIAYFVFEQGYTLWTRQWSAEHWLPLHLCDLAVLSSIYLLITLVRQRTAKAMSSSASLRFLYEIVYYWGLGGALQALLTPDVPQPFPSPLFICYFTGHGAIIVTVLVLTVGLRLRPGPGSVLRVWLLTTVLGAVMLPINGLLDANFMFLCGPPDSPTVLDYLGPWPVPFLIGLDALAAACMTLCYMPFWIQGWRRNRQRLRLRGPLDDRL